METTLTDTRSQATPWRFVPSLYFIEGLPYCLVMVLSLVYLKNRGMPNAELGFWTSLLNLPWVLKPLWSPLVDVYWKKRSWVWITQLLLGLLAGLLALQASWHCPVWVALALLFVCAFLSATHDVAADGFYILSLDEKQQAAFCGVRNTFYRGAMVFGQGGLVMLAGWMQSQTQDLGVAWAASFAVAGLALVGGAVWHRIQLPRPKSDEGADSDVRGFCRGAGGLLLMLLLPSKRVWRRVSEWTQQPLDQIWSSFFRKEGILPLLAFLLTYRLGEGQLLRMATPFLLDHAEVGGLALSTTEVGFAYGVLGVLALLVGGLVGGWCIARYSLRRCLVPMWLCLNLPNALYLLLSFTRPDSPSVVYAVIAAEQLGYGFGFSAYMMVMAYSAGQGQWKVVHYAVMTGFMALGVMLPGMLSGYIQQALGYTGFFAWVVACALPAFFSMKRLRV